MIPVMKKYKYESYSGTIRKNPQNYWVCSIKDGKLVFDSWEGMITWKDKVAVVVLFFLGLIKVN